MSAKKAPPMGSEASKLFKRKAGAHAHKNTKRQKTRATGCQMDGDFDCCGGNDDHPPEHTQDCSIYGMVSRCISCGLANCESGYDICEGCRKKWGET